MIGVRIIDGASGRPVPGVLVRLDSRDDRGWAPLMSGFTVNDGRLPALEELQVRRGAHQLTFDPSSYFAGLGAVAEYREFTVHIQVREIELDLRVAVYLNAAGFAVYGERG
ncbi:hydroxyisourate hydrolase [Micromonospora sp. NBC_00330]|uniref:hydroxyisourate hydrolase n=1 Tax=Micromonospora sp. NBC_00330 TaxID=2903585 RepID=UPI002E2E1402|nr:hydroxyisourate hydrolase [Micromonospora sp. NBC_00330]